MLPVQCKMARAALGIGVRELAELAGMSKMTVSRFENEKDSYTSTATRLREVLESQGVIFIHENGGGPGVRLRK